MALDNITVNIPKNYDNLIYHKGKWTRSGFVRKAVDDFIEVEKKLCALFGGAGIKIVTVNLRDDQIEDLESICGTAKGLYTSRCEAIRVALRDRIIRELKQESKYIPLPKQEYKVYKLESGEIVRVPI